MADFQQRLNYMGHDIKCPSLIPQQSAWLRHGPFATWLVKAARPSRIVELGTHYGFSYFAMCEAVKEANLDTQCFAVDTWQGDEHAGLYGSEVYDWVSNENQKYCAFSTLLRKTFNDALSDVEDGSVDLLHVDGRHFYEDVKEDFESWIPKLSRRAIVLFHDTEVRERNFGVYQYWAELTEIYAGFNFSYQHGLGVLFYGDIFSEEINILKSEVATPQGLKFIHGLFEAVGERYIVGAQIDQMKSDLRDQSLDLNARRLPKDFEKLTMEVRDIVTARDNHWHRIVSEKEQHWQAKVCELSKVVQVQSVDLSKRLRHIDKLQAENAQLVTWLRFARTILRKPFRNTLRYHLAKLAMKSAPILNEKVNSKLQNSIAKRDLKKVDTLLKKYDAL